MVYNNSNVRRQDRLLNEQRARFLLQTSEYGVLSMIDKDSLPYAVPLNFVWDNASSVYIHCATEGKKLEALKQNPDVSFCIIGNVHLLPDKFTTEYESIIMKGKACVNISDSEKHNAIELLLQKLSPNDVETGRKYAEKSFHRTQIIRIDFTEFSGKTKKMMR